MDWIWIWIGLIQIHAALLDTVKSLYDSDKFSQTVSPGQCHIAANFVLFVTPPYYADIICPCPLYVWAWYLLGVVCGCAHHTTTTTPISYLFTHRPLSSCLPSYLPPMYFEYWANPTRTARYCTSHSASKFPHLHRRSHITTWMLLYS